MKNIKRVVAGLLAIITILGYIDFSSITSFARRESVRGTLTDWKRENMSINEGGSISILTKSIDIATITTTDSSKFIGNFGLPLKDETFTYDDYFKYVRESGDQAAIGVINTLKSITGRLMEKDTDPSKCGESIVRIDKLIMENPITHSASMRWDALYDIKEDIFIYILMVHTGLTGDDVSVMVASSSNYIVLDGSEVGGVTINKNDAMAALERSMNTGLEWFSVYILNRINSGMSSLPHLYNVLNLLNIPSGDPGIEYYSLGFECYVIMLDYNTTVFTIDSNKIKLCKHNFDDEGNFYRYTTGDYEVSMPYLRTKYGTAIITDEYVELGEDISENWVYNLFDSDNITGQFFTAVLKRSYGNRTAGVNETTGIDSGTPKDIYDVVKRIVDELVKNYNKTLAENNILNAIGTDEVNVKSLEELATVYTSLRLVYESKDKALLDEYLNKFKLVSGDRIMLTTLKDSTNNKKYALVTDNMCSFMCDYSRYTGIDKLKNNYTFINASDLFKLLDDFFVSELITDYYVVREITNAGKNPLPAFVSYSTWDSGSDTLKWVVKGKKEGEEDKEYYSSTEQASFVRDLIKDVSNVNIQTVLSYITYTYENGIYLLYNGVYGSSEDSNYSDPLYVNNPELNAMNSLTWEEMNDNVWLPTTLPRNIKILNNSAKLFDNSSDENITDNSWYDFVKFLHITSIGFECMNNKEESVYKIRMPKIDGTELVYTQVYGYSVADLDEIFSNSSTKVTLTSDDPNEETFSNDSVCVQTVKAIIGLHDFMDLVGIGKDDWTSSIKEYYELYEKHNLGNYRNNPRLKSNAVSTNTINEPLGSFINISQGDMSEFWKEGYALSSLYVPFETNLYDGSTVTYSELTTDWRVFYYKYGFYRKALLVNTDPSAVINEVISGQKSGYRFATLRDLVYPTNDVVLTVDTNFYNAEKVQEAVDRVDYTSLRGTTLEQSGEAEEGNVISNAVSKLQNSIEDSLGLSAESILKHDSVNFYSNDIAINVTHMEENVEWYDLAAHVYDAYLLSPDEIVAKINEDEYTPTQSFAVVSAIYRSQALWNTVLRVLNSTDKEIFKASKGIVNINSTNFDEAESPYPYTYYMNYLMLEGLERLMKNSSNGQIDLNAPIFCDIFGNIITESGYVVIPACSNATIAGNEWTPYNLGFGSAIGGGEHEIKGCSDFQEWMTGLELVDPKVSSSESNGWSAEVQPGTRITSSRYNSHNMCSGYFTKTINGYMLKPAIISDDFGQSVYMNWGSLNVNGGILKSVLYHKTYKDGAVNKYSDRIINMVIEVLRGAPIDNIDYIKEGIDNSLEISKAGVYLAYKLEDLLNTFYDNKTGNNSMVNYQNLVFVTGFEYIILYIYKLAFAGMILGLFIHLYLDSIKGRIGIRSALEFVFTIACLIFCITLVPDLITYSYYKANRTLLSDDVGYLSTLSYAKELDGSEINVTSLDKPNTTSKIYLKLEDIKFDWIDATLNVFFRNTYETVSDLYEESIEESAIAAQENVIREGDSLYYPIDTLFDDSVLVLNKSENGTGSTFSLQYTGDGDVVSFVCPYYVILQQFVQSVNAYNTYNNIEAMSASISSGENAGHVLTYDLLTQYFNSDVFLAEGYDITGMHYVLEDASPAVLYIEPPFDTIDLDRMEYSMWYPDQLSANERSEKVNRLEEYARLWVSDNKDLFGKLPDEVLIKSFALNMAIKFNQICNVPVGNSYEIIDIDSRDLFRMMIADNNKTYKYFSYGLARFTYECGGAISCIFMMFYIFIDVIIGYIKTIIMVIIIGLLLFNIVFRKLIFTKDSRCIEGYLITCAGIIIFNYMYSLLLALQFRLSEITSVTALVIIFGILVQCIYVALMIGLVILTIKDWRNNGYGEYSAVGNMIVNSIHNMQSAFNNRRLRASNSAYASVTQPRWQQPERGSHNIMEQMRNRDECRDRMASEQDGLYDTTVNGSMFRRQQEQSNYDYEVDDSNPYDRI